VGGLRLLKDDAFYDVLARNDWLFILDPDYVEEVATVLKGTFPRVQRPRRTEGGAAAPAARAARVHAGTLPIQRGLFEGL